MEADINPSSAKALAPVAAGERIQALDVVRGFALIGIFLMNVEFFNRVMSGIGEGMPLGLTGLDWFASWFVTYFVQGKFWTIFSMLFGMGFAVMLTRAERADRGFIAPYLRRILALAVFGAVHYIFIWQGDILFSYAMAAGALMILLYGKWKPIVLALLVLIGVGFIPYLGNFWGIAGGLAFVGLIALYMRSEKRITMRGFSMPLFSFILLLLGVIAMLAAVVLWALPNGPKEARIPVTIIGSMFIILALLSAKYRDPVELRGLRVGATLYLFMGLTMTIGGAAQYFKPPEPEVPVMAAAAAAAPASDAKLANAATPDSAKPSADAGKAATRVADQADGKTDTKADARKPEKTDAEKAAEKKAERTKRLEESRAKNREEERILTRGSYLEALLYRARDFPGKAAGDAGFATVLIGMFLIGVWFVRSGIMENTGAHLSLFRKLAWYALPIGIGLGLAGSMIAVSHVPGDDKDGFQFARGLATLGNLPACVGYMGLVVLMLHSKSVFARISVLAPAGRMALTNYLAESLISTFIFYGYGLGHWGLSRGWQVVYVAVFFSLQVAFSHWWLARFRYGPLEWVWRAFTYRQIPAMRLQSTPADAAMHAKA